MPRGASSWTGAGTDPATGARLMEGQITCRRKGCDAHALLGETTRYVFRDGYTWQPDPAVREQIEAERAAQINALHRAPLPAGWIELDGLDGWTLAACSPRCARLICAEYERRQGK